MQKKYIATCALSALVVGGGATALAVDANEPSPQVDAINPIAYAPVRPVGSAPIPAATALAQATAHLGGDAVVSARIGPAPADSSNGTLPWLYAIVRVPSLHDGLDVEPLWEADLIEGVVVDGVGTSRNVHDEFGGSSFDVVLPDGTLIPDQSGGLGDIVRGQQFSTASDATVVSSLTDRLDNAGLKSISVKVLHPSGPAPAVLAEASDVEETVEQLALLQRELFGDPPNYEGYYLELRDPSGNAFARGSASFRTGAGRSWVDPQYSDSSSVVTPQKWLGTASTNSR